MTNQELKLLAEKATRGPWEPATHELADWGFVDSADGLVAQCATSAMIPDGWHCDANLEGGKYKSPPQIEANRDFIAAANPKTVLDLLSQIDRLRGLLAEQFTDLDGPSGGIFLFETGPQLQWQKRVKAEFAPPAEQP